MQGKTGQSTDSERKTIFLTYQDNEAPTGKTKPELKLFLWAMFCQIYYILRMTVNLE